MSTVVSDPTALASSDKRAQLAKLLSERKHKTAPLSSAQQRLWFLSQLEPGASAYNISGALHLTGNLDLVALERSLNELVRRHETLRTSIAAVDGTPIQVIAAQVRLQLKMVQLAHGEDLQALLEEEARLPFDLTRGPFLRATLFKRSETDHVLLLVIHHIVSDGWSVSVLRQELTTLYDAYSRNQPSPLPELPIQYADFARWQEGWLQSDDFHKQLAYWKQKLAGAPGAIDLPLDKPRPAVQTSQGASLHFVLDASLSASIRAMCQRLTVTPFMFLLSAFQILLWRYSGQEDLVVGTPVAGRAKPETEGLIGILLNTLAIRVSVSGNPSFREFAQRVKESSIEALAHQEAPFERLVEELNPQRDLSRSPIFQTLFILQVPMGEMRMRDLRIEDFAFETAISRFDLTLFFQDVGGELLGSFEYSTDLFERDTIERMKAHYERLLTSILANPDAPIGSLELLHDQDQQRILRDWNATSRTFPGPHCTHQLFELQAASNPDSTAVVFEQTRLSYAELNARSNQLARRLQHLGVGPRDLVGICLERSPEMAVALLAVWKAGAAYVPLDPSYPDDRIQFMLEDAAAKVLISQESLRSRWAAFPSTLLCLDSEGHSLSLEPSHNLPNLAHPEDLAYVIYTSGSTGKPKGVMIPHAALRNFLQSMREQPGIQPSDRLLAVTTLCFDIAGLEFHLPLISGASLFIASREVAIDGQRLAALLRSSGATLMQATPATWRMLLESGWSGDPNLRILCGGEALPRELASQLLPRVRELWNMYGPTETTIWSTLWRVQDTAGPIFVGRPIANTTVYILDSHGRSVPPGVTGELHIGGAGLARGYFKRPELTAEKFIPHPDPACSQERIYRTGDLARFSRSGLIDCLGRLDHQVKLRGHRIELGEIEAALRQQEHVREAVVIARKGKHDETVLLGFVEGPKESLHPDSLRTRLREQLPDYMLPAAIAVLDSLPMTNNGKVNRNALPEIEFEASAVQSYVAPRSETERQLAEIWEEVLNRKPIGIRDNFFDLGGHSLLAARLFTRIEKVTGHHLPVATLFQSGTIEALASVIDGGDWQDAWAPVVALNKGTSVPFFCVHSLGVNLISYKRLAVLLGDDHPFYGLQPHGLDGKQAPQTRIEDMAAEYLKEIRTIQPEGPYRIGGVCMGGVIAFEMAQQLKAAGQEVSLLLAIDSELPGPAKHLHTRPYDLMLLDWHLGMIFLLPGAEKLRYVATKAVALARRLIGIFLPSKPEGSLVKNLATLSNLHLEALAAYRPQPYEGNMVLLWSSEVPIRAYEDRRLAWSEMLQSGLEVHIVPGNHSTMIEEPHVHVLAEKVRQILSRERKEKS